LGRLFDAVVGGRFHQRALSVDVDVGATSVMA
jgi:hypothetical protein